MDLWREDGYFRAGGIAWFNILDTAKTYGWVPEGALEAEYDEQSSLVAVTEKRFEYGTNDGQVVTTTDAIHLAAALAEALRQFEEADRRVADATPDIPAFYSVWKDEELRAHLHRAIAFFKCGQFEIW